MNPAFESLTALAPDALLGLMTAYREDKRDEKFDLGVGVYKDDAGHTPVMSAVAKAEAMILQQQTTKARAVTRISALPLSVSCLATART